MFNKVDQNRIIATFSHLVSIPSESGHEQLTLEFLQDFFEQKNYPHMVDNTAQKLGTDTGNLLVNIPGNPAWPTLLFSAHMDTVTPGIGIKVKEENGMLYSSGETILGSDDKAGIAAILEAVEVLSTSSKQQHPPLELLFTVGEESGLLGSRSFNYDLLKSQYGYVLDHSNSPGSIVIQSPCQYELTFTVRGKAAHAGISPEKGINAIHIMGQALGRLPIGRIDEATTCNLGIINGGNATNIVPEECIVNGEARSLNPKRLEEFIQSLEKTFNQAVTAAGGKPEFQKKLMYTAAALDENAPVVKLAVKAAEQAGMPVVLESTGGGSDASIINGHGIPTVNLGIGMKAVHTVKEYIASQDLADTARLVLSIIDSASSGPPRQ